MSGALIVLCLTTVHRRPSALRALAMAAAHHPGADTRLVVVDDLTAPYGSLFVERTMPPRAFARLAMLHTDNALIASVRPSVLAAVAESAPAESMIVVLPHDAETFSPLEALHAPLTNVPNAAVVLVRTRRSAPPLDGKLPDDVDLAVRGRLDQDLVALRSDDARARNFLASWIGSLERSPHVGPERLDPTSHPWLDTLANLDGVTVIEPVSLPVSIRNADEPGRLDAPALVRWPGFDPATPWLLSSETGSLPRVRPSTHPLLATMARNRTDALAGVIDDGVPAFVTLPNGLPIDDTIRLAYADALRRFEAGNAPEPPNVFAGDTAEAFVAWLTTPSGTTPSPFVAAYRAMHPELADVLVEESSAVDWLRDNGAASGVDRALRPNASGTGAATPPPARNQGTAADVEVVGYLRSAFGMGAAARALVRSLTDAGLRVSTTVDARTAHEPLHGDEDEETGSPTSPAGGAPAMVLVRNADALLADPSDALAARADGRRVVGLWFWEVETFPDRLLPAFDLLDEIWVATEFVAASLRAHTNAPPVQVIPFPLPDPTDHSAETDALSRGAFIRALSITEDRFVVSFSFDYDSIADRKNPWAAVDAFRMAFPEPGAPLPDGRVPLMVLKAIGAERHPIDHDRLLHAIGERPDIVLIERHLAPQEQGGLFVRSDVYLSLHRSEGLGLTIAEAIAVGTPVVCTNYGGNAEFCDASTWLVDFDLVAIPVTTPVYAGSGRWAEPNTTEAADHLRAIALDPTAAHARATAAQAAIAQRNRVAQADARLMLPRLVLPTPSPADPEPTMTDEPATSPATEPASPATHPGLGPVVLPGATAPTKAGGSGVLGAVTDRVRSTVEPMIAAQAAFEQARVVALVDAVQRTRQAVLDIEANASAERQSLTAAITGVGQHVGNLQGNHDALYDAVSELSTQTRTLQVSHDDLHAAIARVDRRLDDLTAQLRILLERLNDND